MKFKKKKSGIVPPENIFQWRKNFLLGKRKALRDKQKQSQLENRDAVFNRRLKEAADEKSPVTVRTKGFYRFTSDYPSIVNTQGLRENTDDKKTTKRKHIIICIVFVIVLLSTFVICDTMDEFSNVVPLEYQALSVTKQTQPEMRAMRLDYEMLKVGDIDSICNELDNNNCNIALIEIKTEYGYVLFTTDTFYGQSADKRIADLPAIITEIKNRGYHVWGSICCFKDTCAATADLSLAVRKNNSEGGAWRDNDSYCYLNPFSDAARQYLFDLIAIADEAGLERIVLTDVSFPTDSSASNAYFTGENESDKTRNDILVSFVNTAVKLTKNAKITLLSSVSSFSNDADKDTKGTHGSLLNTNVSCLCVDARLSTAKKNTVIGDKNFRNPSTLPFVFVSACTDFLLQVIHDTDSSNQIEGLVCIENREAVSECTQAALLSQLNGYIIW